MIHIGGAAANDGVVFYSENHKASFKMGKNGEYTISHSKRLPVGRVKEILARIPFVKGVAALLSRPLFAFTVLFSLFIEIAMYSGWLEGEGRETQFMVINVVMFVVMIGLVGFLVSKVFYRIKRTSMFHGAEHKVVYAAANDIPLELDKVRACPRVAHRCGTNLLMFKIVFLFGLSFVLDFTAVRFILAFTLAYELFDLDNGENIPVIKLFFKLGGLFQHYLFTREPDDVQLSAAIETVKVLVDLEGGGESL